MWAGVWFPSVALSRLWFLHPLCSLQMKCRVHTAGFPFRKPFSLMKVYCGKLYANLFAGLHLGHPSSVSRSYCVLGSGKQVWVQKSTDLNIKSPLMEKKKKKNSDGKGTKRALPFHHPLPVGKVFHPPIASAEQAVAKTRLHLSCPLVWYVQPSCTLQFFL